MLDYFFEASIAILLVLLAFMEIKGLNDRWILFFSALLFFQGISIMLLPLKYLPWYFGILLISISGFIAVKRYTKPIDYVQGRNLSSKIVSRLPKTYFPLVGFFLLILVVLFSYRYTRKDFGDLDMLVSLIAVYIIFFNFIPNQYELERDFTLMFFMFLVILYVVPSLIIGYIDKFPESSAFSGSLNNKVMHYLLVRPLENGLCYISVWVARQCSGIYSVIIFISGYISYMLTRSSDFGKPVFLYMLLGILIAYFANILRMLIVVLSGYYWGEDALIWTHENAGWLIFLSWVFLFWFLLDYVLDNNTKIY